MLVYVYLCGVAEVFVEFVGWVFVVVCVYVIVFVCVVVCVWVFCFVFVFFFLMVRRPPRSTQCWSSAASDVFKSQVFVGACFFSTLFW